MEQGQDRRPEGAAQAEEHLGSASEAAIEHGSAKDLIAQIGSAQASKPLYDARVKVLGEYIRHHVQEEEGDLSLRVARLAWIRRSDD